MIFNTAGVASFDRMGWNRVSTPGALDDALYRAHGGQVRVLYTPLEGDRLKHFEAVNVLVYNYGSMVYGVDEIDTFMQPNYMPPEMYELVNYGRHHDVAMIGCARNCAQVARQYTSMLTEIDVFCMTEPIYLKYIEAACGGDAAAKIPSLGQYQFMRWVSGEGSTVAKGWR